MPSKNSKPVFVVIENHIINASEINDISFVINDKSEQVLLICTCNGKTIPIIMDKVNLDRISHILNELYE